MSAGAVPGRFSALKVSDTGGAPFQRVGGIVDISRSREIDQLECTDHDSANGEREFISNLSNTTFSVTARWKDGDPGQEILLQAAEAKTRVLGQFFMEESPASGKSIWEGWLTVSSEGQDGPLDDTGGLNIELQGSLFVRSNQ